MRRISFLFSALAGLFLCCSQAFALTVLTGSPAADYLGDAKQHFLAGHYTCDILARSHRDSMHGRFSDGVVFNTDGGLFEFLKRKDGDHDLVLDSSSGREEEPVTEEFWRHKVANTLSDDNNIPYVFLDDNRKELAVVYVGNGTKVTWKMSDGNLLEVSISVEGAKDHRGRRRMMT